MQVRLLPHQSNTSPERNPAPRPGFFVSARFLVGRNSRTIRGMAFVPSIPDLIPRPDGTFSVRNWHVFTPGYWRGELFSRPRIAGVVNTYQTLKKMLGDRFSPKVRLGHDSAQRLVASLGLPNAGRVTDLRPTDDGGFAIDLDGTPQKVMCWNPVEKRPELWDLMQAVRNGQYDSGSVEFKKYMPNPVDPRAAFYDVFDGIALLGEEHPAVKTIASIPGSRPAVADPDNLRLAFSDFHEEFSMNPRDKLAQVMGLTAQDPTIASMSDDQVAMMLKQMGQASFSDAYKKTFSDLPGINNPTPPPGGAAMPNGGMPADPSKIMMSDGLPLSAWMENQNKVVQSLVTRANHFEASAEDLRKQLMGRATSGHVLMSDAYAVVDQCVKEGRLSPQIADACTKPEIEALYNLPMEKLVFSDGENKGRSQVAVYLDKLKKRPIDPMHREVIKDDNPTGMSAEVQALVDKALESTADGREAARFHAKKQTAAAAA